MTTNSESPENLGQVIVSALIQFFHMLVFILFLCPFSFWKKAAERLVKNRNEDAWKYSKSNSRWPFLSFIKAVVFGFLFDGMIFISYFVGTLVAFYTLFKLGFSEYGSFKYGFLSFLGILVYSYYVPMMISPIRDLLYIAIMPFSKFLSWCSRPAQYLEIDMNKKTKEIKEK